MSLLITHRCINCDMCVPECPNEAIAMGEVFYQINPNLCTECVDYYDRPNCQSVCPITNAIIKDPINSEKKDELRDKFSL